MTACLSDVAVRIVSMFVTKTKHEYFFSKKVNQRMTSREREAFHSVTIFDALYCSVSATQRSSSPAPAACRNYFVPGTFFKLLNLYTVPRLNTCKHVVCTCQPFSHAGIDYEPYTYGQLTYTQTELPCGQTASSQPLFTQLW